MFWHSALSTTLSISTLWPQMHYIYQNPKNGEFVACDNRVMLIENNGTIPMFEFWNADGSPADVQGLEYVDYQSRLKQAINDAGMMWVKKPVTKQEFTYIAELPVLTTDWNKVMDFVGADRTIYYDRTIIYVKSVDGQRQAIISPFCSMRAWNLMNTAEEVISVCNSYKEAVELGQLMCGNNYIIKEKRDG